MDAFTLVYKAVVTGGGKDELIDSALDEAKVFFECAGDELRVLEARVEKKWFETKSGNDYWVYEGTFYFDRMEKVELPEAEGWSVDLRR